ncbi:MAG: phosphoglucosamine mutase [Actinobacteria bacterium]|nr:phosphoglucosamine mutase [Actinomycetota bacterium]
MGQLFGTDGVRGLANRDLTAELALDLAVAAAHVLGDIGAFEGHRPIAVVGRDGRASGEFLEAAVVAGLASAGVDVILVGVLPTPGVAFLTDALNADIGVMLSASHNPMPDNGIKFFARGGTKLDDAIEDAIEERLREPWDRPTGAAVGRVRAQPLAGELYERHLLSTLPHDLEGISVVVDCANGAASTIAAEIYASAGAKVVAIHASPDGLNINEACGSTHMDDLVASVREHGADVGIAHDGDADRCLAVDGDGNLIDGDHILAILAVAMHRAGRLTGDTVVATVMANLGFKLAMKAASINVVETGVGDRYVLEAMRDGGFVLGGEQSGHVVMSEYATTGDGILTALHLMAEVAASGESLATLASHVTKLPQVLINVTGVDRTAVDSSAVVREAVAAAQETLGDHGRVLLRPSGTEPVIRVMVEAPTQTQAAEIGESLAAVVRDSLSLD